MYLAGEIESLGPFEIICSGDPREGIPAVSWKLKEGVDHGFTLFDLADRLRTKGWLVPAYTMPANLEDMAVQRILVRHGFSRDLAELLMNDYREALSHFDRHPVSTPLTEAEAGGFNHG
jgi:glutamate decarboxylase